MKLRPRCHVPWCGEPVAWGYERWCAYHRNLETEMERIEAASRQPANR